MPVVNRISPSVSVILPAYNASAFVSDAICSVLQQSQPEFELVVVDDCSEDNTVSVVESFSDQRIRLLRQPINQGASLARNLGIASAKGEYVAFLDADDIWAPDFLKVMSESMQETDANLAYSLSSVTTFTLDSTQPWRPAPHTTTVPAIERSLSDVFKNPYMATCTMMCKRSLFNHCGTFDSRYATAEDIDFILRAAEIGSLWQVSAVLAQVRVRDGSLGSQANSYIDHLAVLEAFFDRNPDFRSKNSDLVAEVLEEIYYCYIRQLLVDRALSSVLHVFSTMPRSAHSPRVLMKVLKIVPLYISKRILAWF